MRTTLPHVVKGSRALSATKRINLAERLVAAYVSYARGQKGIDRTLRTIRGRELGQFWLTAADTVLKKFSKRDGSILRFDEAFGNPRNEANKE